MKKTEPIILKDEKKGMYVHRENSENYYVTERKPETLVKKYNGFGISTEIIEKIKDSAEQIRIRYIDQDHTEKMFIAKTEKWVREGVKDELGGFEEQIFLPKNKMIMKGEEQKTGQTQLTETGDKLEDA